ncbi:electron transfer flavoprotein subunit beta/FixA family protein [Gammaproteobacteria bacterium AB-CW1]|uniref:Electron transfer flavoprotein subunit beta n=1 Tax=Natronospira elongata TaxID=3110268 RepID=A0AAP6JG19_9GAMM|nr:electron transfer flavoprotein subunit beta/FixA family protein [Gammaproteobacteria bacterium AB-CW1]
MKILVPIKRTIDYNIKAKVTRDGSGVVTDGVKMSINPFDEIALEEAIRIKERGEAEEIIAVSIGVSGAQQQLRTALAMGADRAILVETEEATQPLHAARILLKIREEEGTDLVLMGKQAIDDDANQTGQMLAALWGRPQATFTSKLTFEDGWLKATREVDAGLETIAVELPAVVTTDLRLNEPRFVKMPDIMKAKRKPLDQRKLEELGVEAPAKLEVGTHEPPPERKGGHKVESVDELVAELKERGVLS